MTESHHANEPQRVVASHNKLESPPYNASHLCVETQRTSASQRNLETQEGDASHSGTETPKDRASQGNPEAQAESASHVRSETPASHVDRETHSIPASLPRLRFLVESYYDLQKLRIMTGNRIQMYASRFKVDAGELANVGESPVGDYLKNLEKMLVKEIKVELAGYPISVRLATVKGVGPILAGGLIAWIGDIGRFATVSKLWAYAGLAVVDGVAVKRKRGEKGNWNPRLKVHAWKLAKSFVKSKGPYRAIYDQAKSKYRSRNEVESHGLSEAECKKRGFTKGHVDNRAMRYTVKRFLSHLWVNWRLMEGLEVSQPYALSILGHSNYEPPPW